MRGHGANRLCGLQARLNAATIRSFRGVAQSGLERLHGVQKVASSNLVAPIESGVELSRKSLKARPFMVGFVF